MDALVFAANLMYIGSYFTKNMLHLRLLTLAAAICLATYFACRAEPLLSVVGWNLFFIVLNLIQIARVLITRRRKHLRST